MNKMKKIEKTGVVVLIGVLTFILIFTYLSLNLKNIDFGYEMQEKMVYREKLREEIAKLKSHKAQLLNLKRVEKEVMEKLGYQYPQPDQFIKVFVSESESATGD
ncbi:MAG: hypothetical protein GTO66_33810 [Candidatus Aminicenantes bacterium]|nr:hypothetical protein [Candidatus Aminicenantes bacterium]NIN46944.1 hypothetical protein [Candidatus Aminicenantes bacterium]